jgi:hypothetical protein
MRRNLSQYLNYQVFLNYPFDEVYAPLERAMHFAVVAANLIPVCAKDLTAPDKPRLKMIIDMVDNCFYSAHDLSRTRGKPRMNMPLEFGMALYPAITTQWEHHRCAFFVSNTKWQKYVSDLSGLDPFIHEDNPSTVLREMYDWLISVAPPNQVRKKLAAHDIIEQFKVFKKELSRVYGDEAGGKPSHDQAQELMYQMCRRKGLWDWRKTKAGLQEFPEMPLKYKS